MSPESVDSALRQILCEQLKISEEIVRLESTFDDLSLDSLASTELILIVEDTFGITIDQMEFAALRTYGDVVRHVTGLVNASAEKAVG